MIRQSINLPFKKRLHVSLVERRGDLDVDSILPKIEEVLRTKKGSKISRYFRHIFEHKNIKKLIGANLTAAIIATSVVPGTSALNNGEPDMNVISQKVTVLTTQSGISYPLSSVKITQGYRLFHPGIDFDGVTGDPVKPIMAGVVAGVDYSKYAYGNAILVDHGSGLTSLYAHLSKIFVKPNDHVTTTTVIGAVGATGRSSGDHLHLEVRDNGIPFNPSAILPR